MSNYKSKQSNDPFQLAEEDWNLSRLFADLSDFKVKGKGLSGNEKKFLKGVLCGHSPQEIAEICKYRGKDPSATVRQTLTKVYGYMTGLLDLSEGIEWGKVPRLLEKYRKQPIPSEINPSELEEMMRILREMKEDEKITISSTNLISIPPTLDKWQGRSQEIKTLSQWIENSQIRTIGIQGLSGIGKSWLAAYLYESIGFESKFWANVRQGTNFTVFAQNILQKITNQSSKEIASLTQTEQLILALINALKQNPCLLVIDNLETLLDNDRYFSIGYKEFFYHWLEHGSGSTILVTTQIKPVIIEDESSWLLLQGLSLLEGASLLRELNIQGSELELQTFTNYIDGHPRILRLVASKLRSGTHINEVKNLGFDKLDILINQIPMTYRDKEKIYFVWILEQHFKALTEELQNAFLNLSLFRDNFNLDGATIMITDQQPSSIWISQEKLAEGNIEKELEKLQFLKSRNDTHMKVNPMGIILSYSHNHNQVSSNYKWKVRQVLDEFISRSLLDIFDNNKKYQFHPFVAQYAKQKRDIDNEALREKLISYYLSIAKIGEDWNNLQDVTPHLECIYHLCELNQCRVAYKTLEMCQGFLDLKGYYFIKRELYEQLINKWKPSKEEKQSYTSALNELGCIYNSLGLFDKSVKILQKNLSIQGQLKNHHGQAAALNNLAISYHSLGQSEKAINFHKKQLKIAAMYNYKDLQLDALSHLGIIYHHLKQYKKAIDYFQQEKDILEKIDIKNNNDIDIFQRNLNLLGNLGAVHRDMGDYEKSLNCHLQQLEISRKIGDIPMEAKALSALGPVYQCLGKYEEAINSLQLALEINKNMNLNEVKAIILMSLGNIYTEVAKKYNSDKDHNQAFEHSMKANQFYEEALKFSQKISMHSLTIKILCNYARFLTVLGKKDMAINLLENAITDFFQGNIDDDYIDQIKKFLDSLR